MSKIKILIDGTFVEQKILERILGSARHEKINSDYTLSFTTYLDGEITELINPNYIVEENDDYFDFVYYKKGQSEDGELTAEVECEHISYRLNEEEYDLEYFTELGTPVYILEKLLEGTGFTAGTVEFTEEAAYSLQETTSRRMALMDFVDYLGGEAYFNKFTVSILVSRGSQEPKDLTSGRNIEIIDKIFDKRGKDKDGNPLISYTCSLIKPMEINLGDIVSLDYATLEIDVSLRVVSISKDPYDSEFAEFEIGNFVPGLEDDARKIEVNTLYKNKTYYGARISPENGFESIRSDNMARGVFNAELFALQAGDGSGGNWTNKLYFDPVSGKYIFDGELSATLISALEAEFDVTIVQNLYAGKAYIADLTVDRINTSDAVGNYLASNTDDIDYFYGQDGELVFVIASTTGTNTIQVNDRDGNPLYWTDDTYIASSTEVTSYPVMRYVYEIELEKTSIKFQEIDSTKIPVITLGAGTGTDKNGKTEIAKLIDGFRITYYDGVTGDESYFIMNDDGNIISPGINPIDTDKNTVALAFSATKVTRTINFSNIQSTYQMIFGAITVEPDTASDANVIVTIKQNGVTLDEYNGRTFNIDQDGDTIAIAVNTPSVEKGDHTVEIDITSDIASTVAINGFFASVQQFPVEYIPPSPVGYTYALFGGGQAIGSNVVDAYDTSLTRTIPTALSSTRFNLAGASVGDYALFGGGYDGGYRSTVDAYDASLTRTTPTVLSLARASLAAASVGDYALFGGGYTGSHRATVDAYDTSLTRTIPTALSVARRFLAAASVGDYALFGGGRNYTNVVDAYDTSLTRTTPTVLAATSGYLAAASVGDYALFGGGYGGAYRNTVSAYDTSLTRTTPTALSSARAYLVGASVEGYALFGGGSGPSSVVDAYDTSLTRTIPTALSAGRDFLAAASVGDYALFGGGLTYSNVVDAYDTSLTRTTPTALSSARKDLVGVSA